MPLEMAFTCKGVGGGVGWVWEGGGARHKVREWGGGHAAGDGLDLRAHGAMMPGGTRRLLPACSTARPERPFPGSVCGTRLLAPRVVAPPRVAGLPPGLPLTMMMARANRAAQAGKGSAHRATRARRAGQLMMAGKRKQQHHTKQKQEDSGETAPINKGQFVHHDDDGKRKQDDDATVAHHLQLR